MNRVMLIVISFLIIILAGCGPIKTTYIEILEPDRVFYAGEFDFQLEPGDILKVRDSKTCRGGYGTCWEVWDVEKKKTGYVSKKRMVERHRVFQKEE